MFRVSCIQLCSSNDVNYNLKRTKILFLRAIKQKTDFILTPEVSSKITLNKKIFFKKPNESVFIPLGAIHRIQNIYKKPVKIIEAQVGSILKETDIVRYEDIYGRVK